MKTRKMNTKPVGHVLFSRSKEAEAEKASSKGVQYENISSVLDSGKVRSMSMSIPDYSAEHRLVLPAPALLTRLTAHLPPTRRRLPTTWHLR